MEPGDLKALELMAIMARKQQDQKDFWLLRAPWRSGLWKSEPWIGLLSGLPRDFARQLLHQVFDECRFGLRCPTNGRFMRNRTVLAGNLASGAVLRLCEGHGARDHQPIKGMIEPGLSRSDYALGNHSRFAVELVKELLGGMWIRAVSYTHLTLPTKA